MTHVSEGKCGKRPDIFTIPFPNSISVQKLNYNLKHIHKSIVNDA